MATNTYVALDKVTVATATPSVTFSSISQEYTDLVLAISSTDTVTLYARVGNGSVDSGTTYSRSQFFGDGTTISSGRAANVNKAYIGLSSDVSGSPYNIITHFQNYSNTSTNKTFLTRYNDAVIYAGIISNLWRSTAAINTITIYGDGANIPAGSTFSLYGIRAEGVSPAPKATGGAIYSDSTYYYHVFGASGTFTPLQSLSADVLVVAGGGGSGSGGGGAGGLQTFASQSLTTTSYTCTVGAGGSAGVFSSSTRGSNGGNSQFGALTASVGGGGSGMRESQGSGASGGSGGGGAQSSVSIQSGGSGTSGQGFAGSSGGGTSPGYPSGGGGGAGAAGGTATSSKSADGGVGATSSLISAIVYATGAGQIVNETGYIAGGGGGAINDTNSSNAGLGGYGGGGNGGVNAIGSAGQQGTGGGAGGGGNGTDGKPGGSGVVVVRYTKV